MNILKHISVALCGFLLFVSVATLPANVVIASTAYELVTERILSDFATIREMDTVTYNPQSSDEEMIQAIEKAETHLNESIQMYNDIGTFSDPVEKQVEPEVQQIIGGIKKLSKALPLLEEGIETHNMAQFQQADKEMSLAYSEIEQGSKNLDSKLAQLKKEDTNTEYLYMFLTAVFTILSIVLYLKTRTEANTELETQKLSAFKDLFHKSLWPLAGSIITLCSYEYAKYSQAGEYFVLWGLIIFGGVIFAIELFKYIKVVRPLLIEKAEFSASKVAKA